MTVPYITLRSSNGFSLVELSIVLIIIAFLTGGVLSLALRNSEQQKIEATETNMKRIEQAIAMYVGIGAFDNDENTIPRLPCPADITLPENNANFGLERVANVFNRTCSGINVSGVISGMIPTRTLNIPDHWAFDGWGRRITYMVSDRYVSARLIAGTGNFRDPDLINPNVNVGIEVRSATLPAVVTRTGATVNSSAAYALISHGRNGFGATPKSGGATPIPVVEAAADEVLNTTAPTIIQRRNTAADAFDDIVRYKLKQHIIYEARMLESSSVCTQVYTSAFVGVFGNPCLSDNSCTAMLRSIADLCTNELPLIP